MERMSREHFKATCTSQFSKTFEKCSSNREFLDMLKKEGIGRRHTGINQASLKSKIYKQNAGLQLPTLA